MTGAPGRPHEAGKDPPKAASCSQRGGTLLLAEATGAPTVHGISSAPLAETRHPGTDVLGKWRTFPIPISRAGLASNSRDEAVVQVGAERGLMVQNLAFRTNDTAPVSAMEACL